MRISDWSSDGCSSDLEPSPAGRVALAEQEGPRSALASRGSGRGRPASQAGRLAPPRAGGALRQAPPPAAALPSAAPAGSGGGRWTGWPPPGSTLGSRRTYSSRWSDQLAGPTTRVKAEPQHTSGTL